MPKGVPNQLKRRCSVCKTTFLAASNRQKYCGLDCKNAARRFQRSPVQTASGAPATTVEELHELLLQEKEKHAAEVQQLQEENQQLRDQVMRTLLTDNRLFETDKPLLPAVVATVHLNMLEGTALSESDVDLMRQLLSQEVERLCSENQDGWNLRGKPAVPKTAAAKLQKTHQVLDLLWKVTSGCTLTEYEKEAFEQGNREFLGGSESHNRQIVFSDAPRTSEYHYAKHHAREAAQRVLNARDESHWAPE